MNRVWQRLYGGQVRASRERRRSPPARSGCTRPDDSGHQRQPAEAEKPAHHQDAVGEGTRHTVAVDVEVDREGREIGLDLRRLAAKAPGRYGAGDQGLPLGSRTASAER